MDLRRNNQHTYHIYMHIGFPKLKQWIFVLKLGSCFFFPANDYKKWFQNTVTKQIFVLLKMSLLETKRKRKFFYFYEMMLSDTTVNDSIFSFWNIIWVIWSPQSWDHNEKLHWLSPHQWSSGPIISILNVNEWKTYGEKINSQVIESLWMNAK